MAGRELTIDLWSNAVAGGWEPAQLESGLGGGEEALLLWAAALAGRGHRVRVYHNRPSPAGCMRFGGAAFLPHSAFDPYERRDVLVSWKSHHPWRIGAGAHRRIHWSSDVERPWPRPMLSRVDAFVTMSPFHRATMPWLDGANAVTVPLGVDLEHLERHRSTKVAGRAIYASSPDRGLDTLLRDWPRLRTAHPGLTLEVYYGWKNFMACGAGNPAAADYRRETERLLRQEGITYRGAITRDEMARAYWEAEFWLLPLNRAESELFCLNAVKAMHCGTVGVVNRIGALQHTVTRWIDYEEFKTGARDVNLESQMPPLTWGQVIDTYWEPIFREAGCNS